MSENKAEPAVDPEGAGQWKQPTDSRYSDCLYRLSSDGRVEILALGARIVVPVKELPFLPEPIARAVLAELAERASTELKRAAHPASAKESL